MPQTVEQKKHMSGTVKAVMATGGVLFALLLIASLGNRHTSESDQNTGTSTSSHSPANRVTSPPLESVNASVLSSSYEKNEVAADQMYKGKRLAVTGRVGKIGKDILDSPYLILDEGEFGLGGVQAFFSDSDLPELAKLTKGQTVQVVGTCDGLMINVLLKNSSLQVTNP
jgi:hypothetical protein